MEQNDNRVTLEQIESLADSCTWQGTKISDKTTAMVCTTPTGFEIVTTSSCVDPKNYDQELGESICRKRAMDKMWELEGYVLQLALSGL